MASDTIFYIGIGIPLLAIVGISCLIVNDWIHRSRFADDIDGYRSNRDLRLELIIIILIVAELFVSVWTFRQGVQDAQEQARLLQKQACLLQDQAHLLDRLRQGMDTTAQNTNTTAHLMEQLDEKTKRSVALMSGTVKAMRDQLAILKEEQRERQELLARKPKILIRAASLCGLRPVRFENDFRICPAEVQNNSRPFKEVTGTIALRNTGTGPLADAHLIVEGSIDIALRLSPGFPGREILPNPREAKWPYKIVIDLGTILPGAPLMEVPFIIGNTQHQAGPAEIRFSIYGLDFEEVLQSGEISLP